MTMKTANDCGSRRKSYYHWPDRALTGFARPNYDAAISFGVPYEPEETPSTGNPADSEGHISDLPCKAATLPHQVILWHPRMTSSHNRTAV